MASEPEMGAATVGTEKEALHGGACMTCGAPVKPSTRPGPPKKYCSDRCRSRAAWLRRKATVGTEKEALHGGASRKRRPLPEVAREAAWTLRKDIERLERIVADDRFGAYKEEVSALLRAHLAYAAEACQDLLSRIYPQEESSK